jgi:SNF2 family DNA or RNA helicase
VNGARIRFRFAASGPEISVSPDNVPEGTWADFAQSLLAHGGRPESGGIVLSRPALRRASLDLGSLLRHHDLDAEYDEAVRHFLVMHAEETRARRESQKGCKSLSAKEVEKRVRASNRFRRGLTKAQLRDLGRLLAIMHGANFSVPGAGKTAALLAIYEAGVGADCHDHLLVVGPKNAFLAWEDEVALCYEPNDAPTVARLAGGRDRVVETLRKNPEIALITYQLLPNVLDVVSEWCHRHKTHIVLDESHRIKAGRGGVLATAALEISDAAVRRDLLSGTPMPNAPEDLRSQIEFLWPGQRIFPDERIVADSSIEQLTQVQESVRPFYARTTKEELKLPPLTVGRVLVQLGPLQRELYDLLRSEAKRLAAGMSVVDRRFLRALGSHVIRLLEAASNPLLLAQTEMLDIEGEGPVRMKAWELLKEVARSEKPAKITKAVEIADALLGEDKKNKLLIWTSFIQNVHVLESLLAKFNPVTLYGAVPVGSDQDFDTREGRIRQFHEDLRCRVMIANPAACGEGISLHQACHYALYLDRTFNAAHYLQSVDRIHRLGLPEDTLTTVQILEAEWTIDARVARRLKAKIDSMSRILNDHGLRALAYDPEDIVEEFPAGIQAEDLEEIVDHLVHDKEVESK